MMMLKVFKLEPNGYSLTLVNALKFEKCTKLGRPRLEKEDVPSGSNKDGLERI